MRNFTLEDLSGSGQYLVRICPGQAHQIKNNKKPHLSNTGFLTTIMYKVGYMHGNGHPNPKVKEKSRQLSCLISMADGWTREGYVDKTKPEKHQDRYKLFRGKLSLIEYLNNPELSEEFRFATQEEVIRVVTSQYSRWRN